MHRRTRTPLLAIAALLLTVAGGCTFRETNVERGQRDQVLHRGMGQEVADLDPHLATQTSDHTVLSALFEGLVAEDPKDLSPVPGVAERWTVSDDQLRYTFFLRTNARWSNGDPVTSKDFMDSWRRVLTPTLGADNASLMYIVQGAEAFHKGGLPSFADVGFLAPDAHTLRITLEHPAPYFLSLLQHWIWWPVHLASVARQGSTVERGNRWARPGTLVGNGPFVLKDWRPGQRIIVEKAPTYWDAETVRLSAIHFYPIEELNTEERAFRSGQLHVTESLPASKIDTYRSTSPTVLRIDPYLGTYFYRINVNRPFLNVVKVRRALSMAVDRQAIVDHVLRGGQRATSAYTPHGTGGYTPPTGYDTDPVTARALLAEAGYPGGVGAPTIDLLFQTSENHRAIAEAIQEMWRRELGLSVRLTNMEGKSALDARRTGDFQILRSSWIGDYADPMSFLAVWRSDSGNNYTGWSSDTYDQLLHQATRTPASTERLEILRRAEALMLAEAPIIPIYAYNHVFLLHPSVRGWHSTLLDHHPYKHVWLESNPSVETRR